MARLSAERDKQVLSDDLNAFVKSEKGYVAGKLPFSGSFERNTLSASHYPVGFLGYLHKENYNIINHNQLSFAEMVSKLVANSPFVNADPYCEQQLFDNVAAILEEIHMATVTFDLSGNIWDELHSLIENRTAAVCVQ